MRIANISGRAAVITDGLAVDVAQASQGRFPSDPQGLYERFDDFLAWASGSELGPGRPFDPAELGAPAPAPGQLFAIGLNYLPHAEETGFAAPASPAVFTKFRSSISGPFTEVTMPGGDVDWEVELVVVVGRRARRVPAASAWDHVAGLTVGQDLSERRLQMVASPPQFSLAKSFPGFAPMGPYLVTPDELADPSDLEIGCAIDGETVQKARTSGMIFPVPQLIEHLSGVLTLEPGDVIFTGTPAGVGLGRTPARYLQAGQVLTSWIEGLGEMRQVFRSAGSAPASEGPG